MKTLGVLPVMVLAWPLTAEVKVLKADGRVDVEVDGKPYTSLYFGPETTKPYLHPLRAADGKVVSRHYPMAKKEGEETDHVHQRGLWYSHGDVNGVDFWANDPSQQNPKKGKIVFKQLGKLTGGRAGSVAATFEWVDASNKPMLRDDRTYTFHASPNLRMIDVDIHLTGIEKAHFGDTKEGTFAIRLATEMNGKHGGSMRNAEGAVGEKAVWGKRSPWVDYCGKVEGETLGVAIFDHPSNPKHPTYWHSRDYGLFATNVFGEHDFHNDKSRDGSMVLEPGKSWRFRYRVVIHSGDADSSRIPELYKQFAALR